MKDLEIIARTAWKRLDKFKLGTTQPFWKESQGSRGHNVAMVLRHRYISQNREAVIGVQIPLYEGATGRSSRPGHSNRHPGTSSLPRLQAGKKLDRHIQHVPFPSPDSTWRNFLPAFTGWPSAAAPRMFSAPVTYRLRSRHCLPLYGSR
jgi:hypothetical protein